MAVLLTFLVVIDLLLAVSLLYTARFFLKREDAQRGRENALVDRLLRQAHVQPVEIERERIVKLPDPEIQPVSAMDQAFFEDDVKEELEQIYPEIARMSHAEARTRYSRDWARMAARLQAERTPLRAE